LRLHAHGIDVRLPDGWEGKIYRRPEGDPTLHAGTFALPAGDGDFGSRATARMRPGDVFLVITEYRPGNGLRPGHGLFSARELPLPLDVRRFHPRSLLVARHGQVGFQYFFTKSGRPFCLYAVHRRPTHATATVAARHGEGLNHVLDSVRISRRPSG
jgi:hypothetical protein